MQTGYCDFCGRELEFKTASIGRNKKAAHLKTCKAYNNLHFMLHAANKSIPAVAERASQLGDMARASHVYKLQRKRVKMTATTVRIRFNSV
jgi:hypothetical protein